VCAVDPVIGTFVSRPFGPKTKGYFGPGTWPWALNPKVVPRGRGAQPTNPLYWCEREGFSCVEAAINSSTFGRAVDVRRREHEIGPRRDSAHWPVALTPLFLLTGIATLLNGLLDAAGTRRRSGEGGRHRQSLALNVAVVFAGIGGAATCAAVLTLLVGALRDVTIASVLFGLFGLAVMSVLGQSPHTRLR
jgi:hypothetical protein